MNLFPCVMCETGVYGHLTTCPASTCSCLLKTNYASSVLSCLKFAYTLVLVEMTELNLNFTCCVLSSYFICQYSRGIMPSCISNRLPLTLKPAEYLPLRLVALNGKAELKKTDSC